MMADDDILDDLLSEAAARRETAPPALMARILADADAAQPAPRGLPVDHASPSRGWLSTLADWFGGGLSLAGMSATAVMGLYLGLAQPAAVLSLAETVTGTAAIERIELLPATGSLWATE